MIIKDQNKVGQYKGYKRPAWIIHFNIQFS